MQPWLFFLLMIICSLIFQGYFTMMEMAILSFNRVRLQYYISQGDKKAIWLGSLLHRPTYLFGTTLIGVNLFLEIGSELGRLFYDSLGLPANLAVITQLILVMIFAELSPMFAARAYAEHVIRIGIAPIYFLSKVLVPFIWLLQGICRFFDWIFKSPPAPSHYLTREELQKAIEIQESASRFRKQKEFDSIVESIFQMKEKNPKELMTPLAKVQMASYDSTVEEVKKLLKKDYAPYIPLFYHSRHNIFGVLYTRDLLRLPDDAFVREMARSPWFITEKNSIFQTLKQFRWNNQHFAVVLDENGGATGILTLDRLIDEMFSTSVRIEASHEAPIVVNKAFLSKTPIEDVNKALGISLPLHRGDTLEELMAKELGHMPRRLESVYVGDFELTLEVDTFLTDKQVRIISL